VTTILTQGATIKNSLREYNLIFITAGLGGGTGTGAVPIISKNLRDITKLTVGLFSTPSKWEGKKRWGTAHSVIPELVNELDSTFVLNLDFLFKNHSHLPMIDVFRKIDEIHLTIVNSVLDSLHGVLLNQRFSHRLLRHN